MKVRHRLLNKLIARSVVGACRSLFATCRFVPRLASAETNAYATCGSRRFIYCVWHDQIAMTLMSGRPQNMAGLVSRHDDASILAESMRIMDIHPIRGSRPSRNSRRQNRGGTQALKQMIDTLQERHVAITPDGPLGPRRQIKDGIVFLASRSGKPIVPTAYSCRRSWHLSFRWTDLMLPVPFTTIYAVAADPVLIPPNISREQIHHYADRLQSEMDRLQTLAEQLAAGQEPEDEPFKIAA